MLKKLYAMQNKKKKGFTLVELMIVVVIIGILTAIAIPVYGSVTKNAEAKACAANVKIIKTATTMYMAEKNGTYPTLVSEIEPFIDGGKVPTCPKGDAYDIKFDTTGKLPSPVTVTCPNHK